LKKKDGHGRTPKKIIGSNIQNNEKGVQGGTKTKSDITQHRRESILYYKVINRGPATHQYHIQINEQKRCERKTAPITTRKIKPNGGKSKRGRQKEWGRGIEMQINKNKTQEEKKQPGLAEREDHTHRAAQRHPTGISRTITM